MNKQLLSILILTFLILSSQIQIAQSYQKMLTDSITEFDVNTHCCYTLLSQENKTQSNCINLNLSCAGGLVNPWYVNGDSLYGGKIYKKILNSYVSPTIQGLIREDTVAKKVYFIPYCNTNEDLLYDFSLQQGDTMHYNFPNTFGTIVSGTYKVDSVKLKHDYTYYYRKHFYLRNHAATNNYTLEMIEGVGSTIHPLFLYYTFENNINNSSFPTCPAANFDLALSCKWNNGAKVYFDSCVYHIYHPYWGGDSCSYPLNCTGIIEQQASKDNVTIYPTPAANVLILKSTAELGSISILNPLGEIVVQIISKNKTEQIDVGSLPSGVYFIAVKTTEGIKTKKIIIQH